MTHTHKVICGWCMTGHHSECRGRHKDYDVWYVCPCAVGECATRDTSPDETGEGAGDSPESDAEQVSESPETVETEATGNGAGPGPSGGNSTEPKPTTRGRPRKGTKK